jgi:DNA-binding NarL/FixJ family response regulator
MRILIAEDFLLLRELLAIFCKEEAGLEVVGNTGTGPETVAAIISLRPDVVILDLMLPGIDGFKVVEMVRQLGQDPKVVAMSSRCDDYTSWRVEHARFQGFIDKGSANTATFKSALASIKNDRAFYSETFVTTRHRMRNNPAGFDKVLTDREQSILILIADLWTDEEIAKELGVTTVTPGKHRSNILRKLGLGTKGELIRYARRHGLYSFAGQVSATPEAGHRGSVPLDQKQTRSRHVKETSPQCRSGG